eukprot:scaffold31047_cov124-Skeletonema_marinoi.AAC.1
MMKEMSRKAMSHSGLHQQQYYRSQQNQTHHTAARYDDSELYQQEGVRLLRYFYPASAKCNIIYMHA